MVFRNELYFLSNMYPCKVAYNGYTYSCAESAFQAQKCPELAHEFVPLDGFQAKKAGRKVPLRPDWESVKMDIMKDIVSAKFNQNSRLYEKLSRVDSDIVEENTWNDTFWGVCRGKGQNHLGRILMQIRGNMKKSH